MVPLGWEGHLPVYFLFVYYVCIKIETESSLAPHKDRNSDVDDHISPCFSKEV